MRKVERIQFNDFMSGNYNARVKEIKEIRKGRIYRVALASGLTLLVLFTGDLISAHAAVQATTGTDGIEKGAQELYKVILKIGKWIIIGKGAIDTIKNMLDGDHGAAKKGFLTYLIVYVILNGLPWALGQVDGLFNNMPTPASGVEAQ